MRSFYLWISGYYVSIHGHWTATKHSCHLNQFPSRCFILPTDSLMIVVFPVSFLDLFIYGSNSNTVPDRSNLILIYWSGFTAFDVRCSPFLSCKRQDVLYQSGFRSSKQLTPRCLDSPLQIWVQFAGTGVVSFLQFIPCRVWWLFALNS